MGLWSTVAALTATSVLALGACSADEDPGASATSAAPTPGTPSSTTGSGHDHSHDGVSLLVGDGTRASEVGYRLRDVRLPESAGEPGTVAFEIERYDGQPVTDYLPDHTKDLHLYVVRSDLAVFRHVHPTMAADGTWSGVVTLPEAGDYRVVTEFVARDESGRGDHVMLGRSETVAGDWTPGAPAVSEESDDGVVEVRAEPGLATGPDGQLALVVSDLDGRPVELGSYLGAQAHVVGFAMDGDAAGATVHLHPSGTAVAGDDGTRLTFVTELADPGRYRFYVQVRVGGFLHTLPVGVEVPA